MQAFGQGLKIICVDVSVNKCVCLYLSKGCLLFLSSMFNWEGSGLLIGGLESPVLRWSTEINHKVYSPTSSLAFMIFVHVCAHSFIVKKKLIHKSKIMMLYHFIINKHVYWELLSFSSMAVVIRLWRSGTPCKAVIALLCWIFKLLWSKLSQLS